jgi:hypothetical protein
VHPRRPAAATRAQLHRMSSLRVLPELIVAVRVRVTLFTLCMARVRLTVHGT